MRDPHGSDPSECSAGGGRGRRAGRPGEGGGDPPGRAPNPAAAGALLVAAIVLCGGAGFGLGALAGAPVPLGLVGVFAGLALGFAVVYSRFKGI